MPDRAVVIIEHKWIVRDLSSSTVNNLDGPSRRSFQLDWAMILSDGWQLEQTVTKNEEEFNKVSKTVGKELARFDRQKARDFRSTIVNYLQCMMNYQQQVN